MGVGLRIGGLVASYIEREFMLKRMPISLRLAVTSRFVHGYNLLGVCCTSSLHGSLMGMANSFGKMNDLPSLVLIRLQFCGFDGVRQCA